MMARKYSTRSKTARNVQKGYSTMNGIACTALDASMMMPIAMRIFFRMAITPQTRSTVVTLNP